MGINKSELYDRIPELKKVMIPLEIELYSNSIKWQEMKEQISSGKLKLHVNNNTVFKITSFGENIGECKLVKKDGNIYFQITKKEKL